jgi:hypothetical protein
MKGRGWRGLWILEPTVGGERGQWLPSPTSEASPHPAGSLSARVTGCPWVREYSQSSQITGSGHQPPGNCPSEEPQTNCFKNRPGMVQELLGGPVGWMENLPGRGSTLHPCLLQAGA